MSWTEAQSAPAPGVRVGGYRLLTKIGEGGMGVVHLAQAPDGRRVALKVLRPHIIGDDEARVRLAREVDSLRRVASPRIAEVIDANPWSDTPFVATRYVPGLSLHEHVRTEGVIEGEDLRWFAACLAEAVMAVHRVGVLHRDIKPSNVLLEGRSPVLIDFGLARLAEDPRLTVTGWLLGTPGYLAPEILYGEDATPASDVHSWAATVVFAATGQPPFGRGPAMAIMDRVRRGEHDLSAVPPSLLPLLRRCLAPDPADRPDLAAVHAHLQAAAPAAASATSGDDLTMPYAVVVPDDDPTDVLGSDAPTQVVGVDDDQPTRADTALVTEVAPAPTTPLTAPAPVAPAVLAPAREPYMTPPPPQPRPVIGEDEDESWQEQPPAPSSPERPTPTARLQRSLMLLGMFGLVVAGFALAPYLSIVAIGALVLVVRTLSWVSEAQRDRRLRRGPRWYDGTLALLSTPWYLLVAAGGTLMLLLWAAGIAFVTGIGALLFRPPVQTGLLVMGAVLAVALWWGPGSRRLRRSARELIGGVTRSATAGWLMVALVAAGFALTTFTLLGNGTIWAPQPGPPWREGTLLADLLGFVSI